MNYRKLGASGLKVSEISLGNWLTSGEKLDSKASHAVFDKAWELGINFYDTADIYAQGEAERILGLWLADKPREEVVVATKCRGRMIPGPNGEGLSKKHILEAAEASLKRLGVDYVDLYQFHWPDEDTPIEESLEAMSILMSQGKVLYAGCSNFTAQDLSGAIEASDELGLPYFSSLQPRYNMFQRGVEKDLIPLCADEGIGIIVWSPLEQGLLTEKYLSGKAPVGSRLHGKEEGERWLNAPSVKALNELAEIAHDKGIKLSQLALAWILTKPVVSSCITGASSADQVAENAAAAEVELSESELAQINSILDAREKALS